MQAVLEKVIVKNFRSYKEGVFDLLPGVNSLTGATDAGKSACMDAIKWVATGKPTGNEFVSWFCDKKRDTTSVELQFSDGSWVRRNLKSGKATYDICTNPNPLEAFGKTVPEEVLALVNIHKVSIGNQLDRPFMVLDNGPDLAKFMNDCANMGSLDICSSNILTFKTRTQTAINGLNTAMASAKTIMKSLVGLDEVQTKISGIMGQLAQSEELENDINGIEIIYNALTDLLNLKDECDYVLKLPIDEALENVKNLETVSKSISQLGDMIEALECEYAALADCETHGQAIVDAAIPNIERREVLMTELSSLSAAIENINKLNQLLANNSLALKPIQIEYDKLIKTVCPTCGRPLKEGR